MRKMNKLSKFFLLLTLFNLFFYYSKANENISKKLSHANIYIEYGEVGKALSILETIDSNNFEALVTFGRAYLKVGEFDKAKTYFEDAIFSSELQDEDAYLGIAKAYLEIGKLKDAYKNIRPLLKSSYKPVETELILIEIELRTGYKDDAKKRILKLLENRRNDQNAIIGYAQYLFLNKNPNDAVLYLEQQILKNKNIPKVYVYLGKIKDIMGLQNEKKDLFLEAAKIYKKQGYNLRAKILLETADEIRFTHNRNDNITSDIQEEEKENNEQLQNRDNIYVDRELENNKKVQKEQPDIEKKLELEVVEENTNIINIKIKNNLPKVTLDTSWLSEASKNKNFVPFKTKDIFFGSGFLINDGSYVITNYHVIKDTSIVLIRTGNGKESVAKVAYYDKKIDLAILKLISKVGDEDEVFYVNNFEDPKPGTDALVIGYPLPDFLGASLPSITEGVVAKTTGLGDNPNNFLITSKVNSGNSGGPIVDKRGCLIGIAVGKLDTKAMLENLDLLPEDMNIGIKSSNASKILDLQNKNQCKLRKNFNRVDLYELLLPKVVFIVAGN